MGGLVEQLSEKSEIQCFPSINGQSAESTIPYCETSNIELDGILIYFEKDIPTDTTITLKLCNVDVINAATATGVSL